MQFLQNQHEAVVEDAPVGVVECIGRGSRTQLFQDIVEAGQRQVRMLHQHAFAKRVEFFGNIIDGDTLSVCTIRERKGRETSNLEIDWIVALTQSRSLTEAPDNVDARG